jgi:ATPase subunit of ABC transporter with duplicated ATPase domains
VTNDYNQRENTEQTDTPILTITSTSRATDSNHRLMHSLSITMDPTERASLSGGTGGGRSVLHSPNTALNPRTSVDDYNRVMLEYTQRQFAAFANNNNDGERHNTVRRGNSGNSGVSHASSVTEMTRNGNGPAPQTSSCSQQTPAEIERASC